jgi:hypothetical protein
LLSVVRPSDIPPCGCTAAEAGACRLWGCRASSGQLSVSCPIPAAQPGNSRRVAPGGGSEARVSRWPRPPAAAGRLRWPRPPAVAAGRLGCCANPPRWLTLIAVTALRRWLRAVCGGGANPPVPDAHPRWLRSPAVAASRPRWLRPQAGVAPATGGGRTRWRWLRRPAWSRAVCGGCANPRWLRATAGGRPRVTAGGGRRRCGPGWGGAHGRRTAGLRVINTVAGKSG